MTALARRTAIAAAASSIAAPFVARAEPKRRWRMATAWPRNLPGPGVSAQRVCDRVKALSGGRFEIELHGAGELVPPFEVFDAVSSGTVECGHAAAVFWAGKLPAAPIFLAVPFGLAPHEHNAWIDTGGGQVLWDRYYADAGVKPYLGGNTGMSMGGWFRQRLEGVDDLAGLRFRMPGFGGRIYRELGVAQVSLPPGETLAALQSGAIDAAEFAGPASDLALGFHQATTHYYWPGVHEPNGSGEVLVAHRALDDLPGDLRAIFEHACAAENAAALSEAEMRNTAALTKLTGTFGVVLEPFPEPVIAALRSAADDLYADLAAQPGIEGEIARSYRSFRDEEQPWSAISMQAFLAARNAA